MNSALVGALALALVGSSGCAHAGNDFDSVVAGVEQRYSVHAERIPLMGFISLCARATTLGGVKGMKIAEFDHLGKLDADGLYSLMRSQLGVEWQPMVRDRSAGGSSESVIFVRPSDRSMGMMIADYQNGELDLVRMEMNGAVLAKWMHHPQARDGVFHAGHSERQTD